MYEPKLNNSLDGRKDRIIIEQDKRGAK